MIQAECPSTKYREGCCWKCICGGTTAPPIGSILHQSRITYREFIKILAYFSKGNTVKTAAQQGNTAEDTVRRFYSMIHERITDDVTSETKIGGVGTVVEVDETSQSSRNGNTIAAE
jgi:hypothetical protein